MKLVFFLALLCCGVEWVISGRKPYTHLTITLPNIGLTYPCILLYLLAIPIIKNFHPMDYYVHNGEFQLSMDIANKGGGG